MQERLVGTIVVVALGVLLIPLWLDGPEAPGGASRDLPGAAGARSQIIRLDADPTRPVVAPAPIRPPERNEERDAVAGAPASGTEGPPAVDGGWAVQVGSFTRAEYAERLAAALETRGFPAFVSAHDEGGQRLLRVRVGPAADRAGAEGLASRLADAGQSVQIVRLP